VDRQDSNGVLVRFRLGALGLADLGPVQAVDPVEEGPQAVLPAGGEGPGARDEVAQAAPGLARLWLVEGGGHQ
jgi:hypothetical protein